MMDRRKITELRVLLVKSSVGGERERTELLDAVGPVAGELLALADAALKIRAVYQQQDELGAKLVGDLRHRSRVSEVVIAAMMDLDQLEAAARAVQKGESV
jgi:hypothetical protein